MQMTGTWRKSTYSQYINCVEVASAERSALVRDSQDPASPVLRFTPAQWQAFTARVKSQ